MLLSRPASRLLCTRTRSLAHTRSLAMAAHTFPRSSNNPWVTVSTPVGAEGGVWLLEMHNLPDNRLEPEFIKQAVRPAAPERDSRPGR